MFSKVTIGAITKNSKILRFIPDHLKTTNMCKISVKILPFITGYAPDWYKTQEICDKAILENCGTLKSVPDFYKNKKLSVDIV